MRVWQHFHMLQCTTLQKAGEKPMLSFHRRGGLRYVAALPGKAATWEKLSEKCQKLTGSHQTCVSVLCTDDEENKADRIRPLRGNVCAYKGRGEPPVHSDKVYEGTPISQQPQACMTA